MPVKILLADKSITIQKVVEMLFSGKEYEVVCVSDGETALSEASRVAPNVVLADIDLPRLDGYSFSSRLKQVPSLAQTPVILMMSRDDVFDEAKAGHASIVDHITKPFESQELIGKVKKAVAPVRTEQPSAAAPSPAALKPQTMSAGPARTMAASDSPPLAQKHAPKQPPPTDIFDIIQDAPSHGELKRSGAADEDIFEVEPVIEVEEQCERDMTGALPVGDKAVEEMRVGLGLRGGRREQDIVSFESLDMATSSAEEYRPESRPEPASRRQPVKPLYEAREYMPPTETEIEETAPAVSEASVRSITEEIVSRIVREIAHDVIEKVAWEVVPVMAAMLIKEEIERLKAQQ